MQKHPDINYLFPPFDTSEYTPRREPNELITVSHATRNRGAKGSNEILRICSELEKEGKIKFIFIEDRPHSEVLEAKSRSDIYIDQITDIGWGYGMNSVEALSMGAVCFTKMNEEKEIIDIRMFLHEIEFTCKIKIAQRVNCRNNSAISHVLSMIGADNTLSERSAESRIELVFYS